MADQGLNNIPVAPATRRTTRSRAATGAGAGQSELATQAQTIAANGGDSYEDTRELNDSIASVSQSKKGKGKKGKKTNRPTVNSLSVAVSGLQEFATGSTNEMSVIRNEVTTNNQMITGLYSRMDSMMKAISDMSSQVTQVNSRHDIAQVQPTVSAHSASNPRTQSSSQAPVTQQAQAQLLGLPPPVELRREENHSGHVDAIVAQEDYRQPAGNGKTQSNISDIAFYKPYMFLDRENLETIKERLDARKSMTAMEYVSATLSLLDDPVAYDNRDKNNILKHLLAVSIDARSRSWPAVRQWTQLIWDNVEKGRCKWDSYGFIQDERVRISYMNSTPSVHANINSQQSKAPNPAVHQGEGGNVVCRDFNSPSGCRFNHTHDVGPIKYLHVCSHCDALGRKSQHSFQKCRTRTESVGAGSGSFNQYDGRQWNNNNRQSNYQGHYQNPPYNQYRNQQYQGNHSKNV